MSTLKQTHQSHMAEITGDQFEEIMTVLRQILAQTKPAAPIAPPATPPKPPPDTPPTEAFVPLKVAPPAPAKPPVMSFGEPSPKS